MDSVIRAAAIYLFILVMIRISGKRTLSETTTFDFVLLLFYHILKAETQRWLERPAIWSCHRIDDTTNALPLRSE